MAIKLKNNHKTGWIITICLLLICSAVMCFGYSAFATEMEKSLDGTELDPEVMEDIVKPLVAGNYILYNEISGDSDRSFIQEAYDDTDQFYLARKYMDSAVYGWDGKLKQGNVSESVQKNLMQDQTEYALRVRFTYGENAVLNDVQVDGTAVDNQMQYNLENYLLDQVENKEDLTEIAVPEQAVITYGMTQKQLDGYLASVDDMGTYLNMMKLADNGIYRMFQLLLFGVAILLGLWIPCCKVWGIGTEKYFRVPFEVVLLVIAGIAAVNRSCVSVVWRTLNGSMASAINVGLNVSKGSAQGYIICKGLNVLMWLLVYGAAFWSTVCLRAIFTMKKQYFRERTLIGKVRGKTIREVGKQVLDVLKKIYNGLLHVDLQKKTNRTILKVVILNGIIFLIVSFLWDYGFLAICLYSVLLFFFLRHYFGDVRKQYDRLLASTNELALGNLEVGLDEDYGIFDPVAEELRKIQVGFKKAVEEEVKSERMKTELITNVSHDLKTPLTAIITYTDLLKEETNRENQKEYIEVLERKSLRLKALIEDLFEISKATSKNVTMNFMKVDIVGLLKQVGLEYDSKREEANLEFKWKLPEGKVILWLDSQKTYRIFENLIVNITKYALENTRVYIEMDVIGDQVRIVMKNVSASELNFDTEEITDRFVRGDVSRKTEGSGLGLAIAKSFTELQGGTLRILTDADLFKVEIVFPCMKEGTDGRTEQNESDK